MKVKLCETTFHCLSCGSTFKEFDIQEDSYGQFILFNLNGGKRYWNTLRDKEVFEEFKGLFDKILKITDPAPYKNIDAFQSILGITCDRGDSGSLYKDRPYCPICYSDKTKFYSRIEPLNCQELDIDLVTHNTWNSLTEVEKKQLVVATLAEIDFNDL
jgi:hypothetical protein